MGISNAPAGRGIEIPAFATDLNRLPPLHFMFMKWLEGRVPGPLTRESIQIVRFLIQVVRADVVEHGARHQRFQAVPGLTAPATRKQLAHFARGDSG
jgi:hypothetical protein